MVLGLRARGRASRLLWQTSRGGGVLHRRVPGSEAGVIR